MSVAPRSVPRWIAIPGFLLLLLAGCWRFYDLSRDPGVISGSAGDWLDPGAYLYNARAYALFDNWRVDQGIGFYVTPGYTLLSGAWFKIFGATYSRAVLLTVLSGWIVIICTAICAEIAARQWFSPTLPRNVAGGAAVTVLLLSYTFFVFQQVPKGDIESMAVCSVAAMLLFSLQLISSLRWLRLIALLAGFCVGIAPFVKFHAGAFSMSAVVAWLLGRWVRDPKWRQTHRQATLPFIIGIASAALVWGIWYAWMVHLHIASEALTHILQIHAWFGPNAVGNPSLSPPVLSLSLWRFVQANLVYRHPAETCIAAIAVSRYLFLARRNWSLFLTLIWVATGLLLLASLQYAPLRYRILFVSPVVIVVSHFWASMLARRSDLLMERSGRIATGLAGFFLGGAVLFTIEARTGASMTGALWWVCLVAIAFALFFAVSLALNPRFTRITAISMAVVSIVMAIPQWYSGERDRDHQFAKLADQLPRAPARVVLGGDVGMQVALWTNLDSFDLGNTEAGSVTHLFLRKKDYEMTHESLVGFRRTAQYNLRGFTDPVVLLERIGH